MRCRQNRWCSRSRSRQLSCSTPRASSRACSSALCVQYARWISTARTNSGGPGTGCEPVGRVSSSSSSSMGPAAGALGFFPNSQSKRPIAEASLMPHGPSLPYGLGESHPQLRDLRLLDQIRCAAGLQQHPPPEGVVRLTRRAFKLARPVVSVRLPPGHLHRQLPLCVERVPVPPVPCQVGSRDDALRPPKRRIGNGLIR